MAIQTINGRDVSMNPSAAVNIAAIYSGLESGAKTFVANKTNAEEIEQLELSNKHQDNLNKFADRIDSYLDSIEDKDYSNMDINPTFDRVIVKPFENNPFQRVTKVNGLYVDMGGKAPEYQSKEDGRIHEEEAYIKVGTVVKAGDLCKYLKEGDIVMWRKPSATIIPFYRTGFVLLDERNIMTVIN